MEIFRNSLKAFWLFSLTIGFNLLIYVKIWCGQYSSQTGFLDVDRRWIFGNAETSEVEFRGREAVASISPVSFISRSLQCCHGPKIYTECAKKIGKNTGFQKPDLLRKKARRR